LSGLSSPKRRVVYDGEIWHADAYRSCAGHVPGFMLVGVVVTKIMAFFQKCGAVTSGRSVRPQAVGLYQPAGWLAAAACWPATVTQQACRNLIGPCCVFTNVGRWPKRAGCMHLPRANQATKSSL